MKPQLSADTIRIMQRQRQLGLGWRFDGLEDWKTEALFAKLQELDIDIDIDRFAAQAQQAGRCSVLSDTWAEGKERFDLWDDFPFMAAEELWLRLTPELLCPETVSKRLDDVIRILNKGNPDAQYPNKSSVLKAAVPLMDYLESFPSKERAAAYEEVRNCSTYDYSDVLLDAIMSEGGEMPDEATRLVDVLSQADPDLAANCHSYLPYALIYSGRQEEAFARIQENLLLFPNDPWVRMHAGEVYEEAGEDAAALDFYISALKAAGEGYEWDAIKGRTIEVLEKMGRTDKWAGIQRKAPRPTSATTESREYAPPSIPPSTPAFSNPLESRDPFRVGHKIGANDPCPCGSGKKYKKCCKP